MRRIGILLTIAVLALIALAAPAGAEPNEHASTTAHDKVSTGEGEGNSRATATDTTESSGGAEAQQLEATAQDTTAQDNSGKGMNRQGGPSEHPGKGWKDPGQEQGSPANVADPDCTGNRTVSPQDTNIGDCDDPAGAADKPGGSGGFDADRDWNNGCGNDTDFEDDNNGLCLGPSEALEVTEVPPSPPSPPAVTPPGPPGPPAQPSPSVSPTPLSPPAAIPPEVLGGVVPPPPVTPQPVTQPVTPQPAPVPEGPTVISDVIPPAAAPPEPPAPPAQPLPATGSPIGDFTTIGLGLVGIGMVLLQTRRRLMRW